MFSFLNFSFEFDGPRKPRGDEAAKGSPGRDGQDSKDKDWRSHSNTTSPMSSSSTPKTEQFPHTPSPMKPLRESPDARSGESRPARPSKCEGVRRRRSSVFFKLPDLESVPTGGPNSAGGTEAASPATAGAVDGDLGPSLISKFSRPANLRRSRRASVAPGGGSPRRTRADRILQDTTPVALKTVAQGPSVGPAAAAVAEAAVRKNPEEGERWTWRNPARGDVGTTSKGERPTTQQTLIKDPPRSSPRALSAGHRYCERFDFFYGRWRCDGSFFQDSKTKQARRTAVRT